VKLRAGRKVGRTLYDVDTDALIGVVDTPELAAAIVSAVNERDALRERLRVSEAHTEKLRAWLEETYATARTYFTTNVAMEAALDALKKKHREEN